MFNLNPLDVLKQRKLTIIPVHFKKIAVTDGELFEGVEDWIKKRLNGRYFISKQPEVDSNNSLRSISFIGFEDQKELTYFILACPLLRRN